MCKFIFHVLNIFNTKAIENKNKSIIFFSTCPPTPTKFILMRTSGGLLIFGLQRLVSTLFMRTAEDDQPPTPSELFVRAYRWRFFYV